MANIDGVIGGTAFLKVTITKIERIKAGESIEIYYTLTYPGGATPIRILQANNALSGFSGGGTPEANWEYELFD